MNAIRHLTFWQTFVGVIILLAGVAIVDQSNPKAAQWLVIIILLGVIASQRHAMLQFANFLQRELTLGG